MYLSKVVVDGFRAASHGPLECEFPGRFSVVLGANSTGKSTITDALAIAHNDVFPWKPRATSATLTRDRPRTVEVTYEYELDENVPIWRERRLQGVPAPSWTRRMHSSLGMVRSELAEGTSPEAREVFDNLPLLYFASTRNPVQDLGGRDSRLIVELLRSEAKRRGDPVSLAGLRSHLGNLIRTIVESHALLSAAEKRVNVPFGQLTSGVSERSSFLATTEVDDTFLERIFEFFVGLSGVDRDLSRRLEVEGLGYANLLQLAVVLAAIPDLTREDESGGANEQADRPGSEATDQSASPDTTIRSEEELRAELGLAEAAAAAAEDSFFSEQFNACVLLEEPEAHLHPQLQYGLVHHLKSVVRDRPEIQIILTTHSDEIVAACDIEDLVVCRRSGGGPVSRTIARLPLTDPMKRLANRHLDASRSASMFADRVVVVEGITDAQLLRAFGKVWACDDSSRRAFLDSLTITVVGSRIGSWLPTLLASPDQEIATRVALLMDSDGKPKPRWAIERENDTVRVFLNEPTLEPSIYSANADLCLGAMVDLGYDEAELDAPPTEDDVAAWFSGTGRRTKARFADTIDAQIEEDISVATLPEHFGALLEFIYEGHEPAVDEETEEAAEIAVTE